MNSKPGSSVHSVDKAMELIGAISAAKAPMTLNELSAHTGYPKSTIHALLSTLRNHNIIEQQSDGKYFLGIRLFQWGCVVSSSWDISSLSRPYLDHLSAFSGATSFICVISGNDVVTFDQCSGNTGFHIISDIGNRLPLHCTSSGKLFLSTLTKPELNSRLTAAGMPAFTPHTITSQSALSEELSKVRLQGYALEDGEYRIGLRSVSAPVYDASGSIKYTLGVLGLFRRINSQEFDDIIANVVSSSNQLSRALGYR